MTARSRAAGRAVAALLWLTAPLSWLSPSPAPQQAGRWRQELIESTERAREVSYEAETVWIDWESDESHVSTGEVVHAAGGPVVMQAGDGVAVDLSAGPGAGQRGVPLPTAVADPTRDGGSRLAAKYAVERAGREQVLDRLCTVLDVRRRSNGELRERLWLDDASGLLLRRERYEGDRLIGLGTFRSLDIDGSPGRTRSAPPRTTAAGAGAAAVSVQRVVPVDEDGLEALRASGWVVPAELPGGYVASGGYAMSVGDAAPLQLVYSDGLYAISLFQQQGTLEPDSLPPGAEVVEGLGWRAYEWPGAMPRRLVWEASGTTFALVGDAPPSEFAAIAASLPTPEPTGPLERLGKGLTRLWEWLRP